VYPKLKALLSTAVFALGLVMPPSFGEGIDVSGFGSIDGAAAGTTALPWLRLPVGARNVAMGGRSLTTDEDATAQIANPAMVALAQHTDYALAHSEILGEFRLEHLCLAMPWRYGGNLGVTLGALFTGTIDHARDIDEEPANPSASDILVGAAFGRNFMDGRLALGTRLDLYRSAIDNVSAYGAGLGLGVTWNWTTDWRIALALRNLGPGAAYATPSSELQTQPMAWNFEIGKAMLWDTWSWQAGVEHEANGVMRYYTGGEWLWRELMLFRLGYEGVTQDQELGGVAGLSAGIGVRFDAVTVDYGFKQMGYLGAYQSFGLSYSRKLKDRRNDEFLLRQAKASYAEGDYRRALKFTKKALAYNAKNYKAQALLSVIMADLERLDDRAFSILFTANTRGSLAPQWIQGKPLGGLARRAAKLKELRQSYPHHVLVDAGDLLTATAKDETRGFMAAAYAHMNYDAIGVGPLEMARGTALLGTDLPFVASQQPWSDLGGGVTDKVIQKMPTGNKVVILAVTLDASANQSLESAETVLQRNLARVGERDLVIVLAHGTLQQTYLLAQKLQRVDVMVVAGESGALQVPMQAGHTFLVCPGSDGVFLGQLSFVFEKNGKRRSYNHRLIPLDIKVPEDEVIDRLLSSAIVDLNKTLLGDGELEITAKALPFLDDSASVTGRLSLLDIITGTTYPVPSEGRQVIEPAVAWGRNLIAFASPTESGGRELYSVTPGKPGLDTLTRQGGVVSQPVFGLRGKAVFAIYSQGDQSDLVRIDPWRHEMNNLTQGRMGQVRSFALSPQQDRLIFAARLGKEDIITLAGADLSMPMPIAHVTAVVGPMVWSPDGERFAYLKGLPEDSTGEIQIFDTRLKGLDSLTGGSSVHEMAFSLDSKHLYFSAGESVSDLNVADLDSMTLSKVTEGGFMPRSERFPTLRNLDGQEKILFLSEDRAGRHLILLDTKTKEEKEILSPRPGLRLE
jgi:hypothetical protein